MPEEHKIPYIKFEIRDEFGQVTKCYKEIDSGIDGSVLVDEFKLFMEYLQYPKQVIDTFFINEKEEGGRIN